MEENNAPYFTASPVKLILLSLCTFGYYGFYWFYRNWVVFKARTGRSIRPVWRAALAPLWAYALFSDLCGKAQEKNIAFPLHPVVPAVFYVGFLLFSRLSSPYDLIAHLSFLPLLVMNNLARAVCRVNNPAFRENGRFGAMNCLALLFGGLILALSVFGTFYHGSLPAALYQEFLPANLQKLL